MAVIKTIGKLAPGAYKQMIDHLTRKKIKNPFIKAKDIVVDKKPEVEQTEMFNRFNKANPRQDMAGGGMLVQPGFSGVRQGYAAPKDKLIDKDLVSRIIEIANNENKFVSEEGISKLYAEATGQTNVTKRKYKDRILTYKKLDNPTIRSAAKNTTLGYLETKEDKVKKVFQEILSMDGPVPKVNLGQLKDRKIADYKRYIINETGVGTTNVDKIVKSLPSYKKNKDSFKYLEKGRIMKTDLIDLSLTDQLKYADQAREGRPKYVNLKGVNFSNPNYVVMDYALRNWNANKGKGKIKFYDANGNKITWKSGLDLSLNKVSFSQGQSKQRFGIGKSDKFTNIRLFGKNYFPEVYENVNLIRQLKTTKVDNPFRPGTQTSFLNLMKRIYIKNNGFDAKAPLFSVFHGPGGVAKEPFKNLSFGLLDLNRAVYNIEQTVPLKGLKNKILNQAYGQLKGKSGENLINAIINEQVNIAREIKKGKNPLEGTLRERTFKKVLETESLGTRERNFLEKTLAGLSNNPKCIITFRKKKVAAEGGRIGYVTGSASLTECAKDGARVFNDGKLNTADQIKDGAKLLRGGRAVLSALSKYGIVPELAYVGLEAAGKTVLGEKPTNALLKSIDTLTFGATDFTSEIEAEKFGEYAKDKLAVDAFRGSQAKVRSILNNLEKLEQINLEGGDVDVTQELQTLRAQLKSASDELRANTVNPDLVQFIDKRQEEISDAELAKSPFAKKSLTNQLEGFPGIKDYMDTEATRVFPFQQTQKQLNENVLNTPFLLRAKTSDIINDIVPALRAQGVTINGRPIGTKDVLDYQKQLREKPLSEVVEQGFNPESLYGARGTFSTPLPSGALDKKPNIIPEMEREIVGQTNVANPFDIDISDIGSGLRGFAAAGGGIAKEAGDRSGPPPERGPNSQGLPGLLKRVRNL